MSDYLPPELIKGASLRGSEWAWNVSSFPEALRHAEARGYACLGGQFQFRLADGRTCEMYWLDADSKERNENESWEDYSRRSCAEVLVNFNKRISEVNFASEAANWQLSIDVARDLVFVAYFVTEADLAQVALDETR